MRIQFSQIFSLKLILIFGTFPFFIIFKIQQSKMRPQRNKQLDWSKAFKLVDNKKQFEQIQTGEDIATAIQNKQEQAKAANYKKQNIITPRIQTIQRVTQVKPFAKSNPNYIRLPQRLNLPKLIDYELTEVEVIFVKTHAERYKFKGKIILTQEFLSKAFIEMQLKAGKQMHLPRSKAWMDQFLQKQFKELHDWQLFETFSTLIYNFWRNRRQQLKFPLLRPLWRPNPDEFNHLLAFKPRQKQKRNLRKTTRISQDDILAELNDQFLIAKQITQRVEMRQQLRLKHVQTQLSLFHNQCKSIFGMPNFFGQITHQSRLKDKQKIRTFHQKLDKIKTKRQEPLELQVEPIVQQVYDQKLSIVNFLATVAAEAENFGISYSTVFQAKSQPITTIISLADLPPQIPQEPQIIEPLLNINLSKAGDFIIRDFNSMQPQSSSEQSAQEQLIVYPKRTFTDILDFKKTKVCSLYFGDDDEGDFKDLRKNISANFKKFQAQIKQS